jgi:uncharacterized membrane protein YqjE
VETPDRQRSVLEVASDALSQASELIQIEFRLARAELGEKITAFQAGLVLMILGAAFLIAALILLLQWLVAVLIAVGVSAVVATLLVAILCFGIGAILIATGKARLAPQALVPERTLNQMARDGALAKEKLS